MNYKKCTIERTKTTTDVYRECYGKKYTAIANVYGITGRIEKNACQTPFLTSIQDCKDFINNNS